MRVNPHGKDTTHFVVLVILIQNPSKIQPIWAFNLIWDKIESSWRVLNEFFFTVRITREHRLISKNCQKHGCKSTTLARSKEVLMQEL
jgi:hypothetical protein